MNGNFKINKVEVGIDVALIIIGSIILVFANNVWDLGTIISTIGMADLVTIPINRYYHNKKRKQQEE